MECVPPHGSHCPRLPGQKLAFCLSSVLWKTRGESPQGIVGSTPFLDNSDLQLESCISDCIPFWVFLPMEKKQGRVLMAVG